jgi:hypothetical protein
LSTPRESQPHDDERAAREAYEGEAETPEHGPGQQHQDDTDERVSNESGGYGPPGRGEDA